ncbi:MAG: Rrf2 family transcriptional regulator [Actinomycetota bacterium]|nr:Rrf2 family transcriptional regulator [Actinomycetota bacterium]
MNISSKAEYGIRAMVEIAASDGPLKRSAIARRQGIPIPFLTQVLRALVNTGLVSSSRGPYGGYLLAQPADSITLLDIVTRLQGPVMPKGCLETSGLDACLIGGADCLLRDVWSALKSANEQVLRGVTLDDLSPVHKGG